MMMRYWTTLSVKLVLCELDPETPLTAIVPLPSVALGIAVRIKVTFKAALAGSCTGLEGA